MSWLLTKSEIDIAIRIDLHNRGTMFYSLETELEVIAQAQLTSIAKRLKAGVSPEDLKALYKEAGLE